MKSHSNIGVVLRDKCKMVAKGIATVALFAILLIPGRASAQQKSCDDVAIDTVSMRIYFPIGKSAVDTTFGDNGRIVRDFLESVKGAHIRSIGVTGQASPDGSGGFNKLLSQERAANLSAWLQQELDIPASIIRTSSKGVDWEGLEAVVAASDMLHRDEVLNILRNVPESIYDQYGNLIDGKKKRLMDFNYGRTWLWMVDYLFPQLRSSASNVVCCIDRVNDEISEVIIEEVPEVVEEVVCEEVVEDAHVYEKYSYPVFAFRTNF